MNSRSPIADAMRRHLTSTGVKVMSQESLKSANQADVDAAAATSHPVTAEQLERDLSKLKVTMTRPTRDMVKEAVIMSSAVIVASLVVRYGIPAIISMVSKKS